jgi:hypothetical protein
MTTYADCTTKVEKINFIKQMVATNDKWMLKALHTIYQYQTSSEQVSEMTSQSNGVGFTGVDGKILASFAKQFIRKGGVSVLETCKEVSASMFFSPKQIPILRKKMPKYARQLVQVAESAK